MTETKKRLLHDLLLFLLNKPVNAKQKSLLSIICLEEEIYNSFYKEIFFYIEYQIAVSEEVIEYILEVHALSFFT